MLVDLSSSRDSHLQHAIGVFIGMYELLGDVKQPDLECQHDDICDVKMPCHSTGNRLVESPRQQ
jgi:hypothetical protein